MTKILAEYVSRRQKIFNAMKDNSIAFLSAAEICYRNNDTEYPYRQCSYFHYVCPWPEPNAIAVLLKSEGRTQFILFCQAKEPAKEQWTGLMIGPEGACAQYGADVAYPISELTDKIVPLLEKVDTIYTLFNARSTLENQIRSWMEVLQKRARQGIQAPHALSDLRTIISELRLFKSPQELQHMQKACEIASKGHREAMRLCRPQQWEYEIEAILLYEFYKNGSHYPAYPSIVAGGDNACILHYVQNASQLQDNSLLLIDAGAEYEGYASDITRTFPVNGKFSSQQQKVYEWVLAAQQAAIDMVRPGVLWPAMQEKILTILVEGLIDLKILKGDISGLIEQKAYAPFYMHNSGHWLGLDVHDVGDYKVEHQWRALQPGMAFTIEPGLYLNPHDANIPEDLRGIGIRIEDDIVLTDQGCTVLSDVPKTVSDIERWMQS